MLAVADALKRRDKSVQFLYIGRASGIEAGLVRAAKLPFRPVLGGKFRRLPGRGVLGNLGLTNLVLNLRDIILVFLAAFQAMWHILWFRPDVIFNKAGTVGLPVGLAAWALRVPMVIHEPDSTPGLNNKILAKWAAQVAVGFPVEVYRFWHRHLIFTGTPVRPELMKAKRLAGLDHFGFDRDLPTVLVIGGSQGAHNINQLVETIIDELTRGCQVIHVTGPAEYGEIRKRGGDRYFVASYLKDDFALAYAAADVVVSRAGANTIAELATLAKPSIIIPNRQMAAHQVGNARRLDQAGAAVVLNEAKLSSAQFLDTILDIVNNPSKRAELSHNIKQFGAKDAADKLAQVILQAGGDR